MRWPGRRWLMDQALDDCTFSRDVVRGRQSVLAARLERFAGELATRAREAADDEIIIVGHSLGASLAVQIVARALARDPDLGRHGPRVCVLTVGSTIAKFSLHPAAEAIRADARQLAADNAITWAEYHARDDAISFYKFDPVTLRRIPTDRLEPKPAIRRVQLHNMLSQRTWRMNRFKFMRMHYQFVMANEKRALYDYFMLICGPAPFWQTVSTPDGPLVLFADDGSFVGATPAASETVPRGSPPSRAIDGASP
jgi:pimeloyl-ACP methyl ester carboxylesterase